mmetsp:Transcript_2965/g.9899  ORF Transcript_2965/g.9899 Transcript_2965/m.9899 type:complete len:92 (+) Transcript_2965:702-977(+)
MMPHNIMARANGTDEGGERGRREKTIKFQLGNTQLVVVVVVSARHRKHARRATSAVAPNLRRSLVTQTNTVSPAARDRGEAGTSRRVIALS